MDEQTRLYIYWVIIGYREIGGKGRKYATDVLRLNYLKQNPWIMVALLFRRWKRRLT